MSGDMAIFKKGNGEWGTGNEVNHFPRNFA